MHIHVFVQLVKSQYTRDMYWSVIEILFFYADNNSGECQRTIFLFGADGMLTKFNQRVHSEPKLAMILIFLYFLAL